MGLFSSKKIIRVASVVYNMAGDEKDRTKFLPSLVARNVLSGTSDSIGETLRTGYANGPAMKYRQFFNWVQVPGRYDQIGNPTGEVVSGASLSPSLLNDLIPNPDGLDLWCQKAEIKDADISYWADQWILDNRPDDIESDFTVDYSETTGKITITFPDTSTAIFTPINFDYQAKYVYAYYTTVSDVTVEGEALITYNPLKVYIYKVGSGNAALDALVSNVNYNEFFPFIPVRLRNKFLSETFLPDAFAQTAKAYKKITGDKLDDLITKLADNESLEDIDNAYVVFGVPLNTKDKASARYLYRFFDKLRQSQVGGPDAYATYKAAVESQRLVTDTWRKWQDNHRYDRPSEAPAYDGTTEPPRPNFGTMPANQIRIRGSGTANAEYDVRLNWTFISSGSGTGRGKPNAGANECWIQYLGEDEVAKTIFNTNSALLKGDDATYKKFRIYLQETTSSYTWLDVVGAVHTNYVYGGKSVVIECDEALKDVDESGFIVPLHNETYREISIADATQMACSSMFLVFNCYEVKKQKWYQTGIFKFLFAIVIAIVSVVFTGGAGLGLLGANLAVGVSLGFTGMTAAIVGAVANALAAMVLSTLIEGIAKNFGKFGAIIAAIFSVFVGNLVSTFQNTGSLAINWTAFLKADNLLSLTEAVGKGVAGVIEAETQGLYGQMADYANKALEETKKIQQAFFEELGYGAVQIDPFMFVDSSGPIVETSDTFLTRTLMTGSDIAEMSRELIYSFPELSLKLPDAFT